VRQRANVDEEATVIDDRGGVVGEALRDKMVAPGDEAYETARTVWNAVVDRRPAVIIRCTTETDVQAAVLTAREQGLQIAVRSGGHSMAGFGTIDGGMVIDLSGMKGIEIDPESRVARLEPGLTWLEVAKSLSEHGLALSSGDMGTVGVGGLTLGGGIGFMTRKYGLTIDHLRAVRLVTADGEVVTADAETHADLFWALRGGGGNFGIATSFEFEVDHVPIVVGGLIAFDAEHADEIVPAALDYLNEAPRELTAIVHLMTVPPHAPAPPPLVGRTLVAIIPCYSGSVEEGTAAVAPLQSLGEPLMAQIGPLPYWALLEMVTELAPTGLPAHVRTCLVRRLDGAIARDTLAAFRQAPPTTMLQLRVLGGAGSTVDRDATAFAHRSQEGLVMTSGHWPPFMDAALARAGVEMIWDAARPYAEGAYIGFLGDDSEERIHDAYPPDVYQRLVEVKRRYDPHNVFSLNTNVVP
jgi:FAD/FMN-containing dehydrogenase